ncbi:MAG: Crp/Fnr family transcriptional regulator [Dehalococcoidia bacterium]|jgi:CRP-like cAMP-binding protein|nr:Crp/Fnr family transcriptional regulator [Tepidiformaceae bacterium]
MSHALVSSIEPLTPGQERTIAALERFPLFGGLSRGQITDIALQCSLHRVPAHRRVFEEREHSKGLWVITSGRVRLHHLMADGRQHVVGFRAPTAALDLTSAMDRRPYTATATTLEDAELVLVPGGLLQELGELYPVTVRNAIDLLCLEVRQRDITTAIATLKDARGRIACTLLQLARQFGRPHGNVLRIDYPLTRQDIADRSGVTVETAIRVMSDLQRRGVLRTGSQIIDILHIDQVRLEPGCEDCQFDCSVFASRAGWLNGRAEAM